MAKKKIKLNVVLLKNNLNIAAPETFIENYLQDNEINFNKGNINAILYKKLGSYSEPKWVANLKNKIVGDFTCDFPSNQSSGVTLFIEVQDRIFAINFGTLGRFNINKNVIEKTFGIYTANKLLNNDLTATIKSAHSRVNETNPVNKQRQYGADISNNQLFLSMEDNEALKELAVISYSSEDFSRMIGKYSSLNVQFLFNNVEIPCFQYLQPKLSRLLDLYKSVSPDDVKKLFKGIYPLNSLEAEPLNTQLPNKLIMSTDTFFLFEPEIDYDLSLVAEIKIEGELYDELSLSAYLDKNPQPSFENLTEDKIFFLNEDGDIIKEWSILECLYGEIEENNTNYILSGGEWFEVSKDKYDRVSLAIDEITNTSFGIPDHIKHNIKGDIEQAIIQNQNSNQKINKENIFNIHLSNYIHGYLFDEAAKQINLYEDRFEVCDVLHQNTFFHVKYNYGASALSHLFNQGYVSAKSYAEFTSKYAEAVNLHIPDATNHLSDQPDNAKVHYLILNDKSKDRLTFFSKMALEEKIRTLQAMRFNVNLTWIRDMY
ncbi:uncharacterized protein (TIGR04141 family) [Chryseobacterium vietnamense]|jgi:uncharacterized protein (TIGR04141 family)|uniref:Uncharacterized protein (TIGR04141 family) n=1 Tax=Chryseobacterium vietnamense TaxID=866785 RepID=A0ACC6J6V0_9FLAO|nr:DUF6119 family protein [Chryseobacterium vietnamense]MDR6458765.1 uncharacterized protein (TIGR04141 family) [Chryseobacterium vietnamense]